MRQRPLGAIAASGRAWVATLPRVLCSKGLESLNRYISVEGLASHLCEITMSATGSQARATQEQKRDEIQVIVGKRHPRYDARLKASGAAVFGTDVSLPNLLHGKIFRSTYQHARIVKLDVSKARSFPGVRAVVTAEDFPDVRYGSMQKDLRILARDTVKYQGQPICAVAAETVEIAEKALAEIEVEYDALPSSLTTTEALREGSLPINPEVEPLGSPPYKSKNVASYTRVRRGDVERAFDIADFVVEGEYQTQQVHQSYIEPHASMADVDGRTGKIRVWTSTQSPFWVRNSLAEILSLSVSQIQVMPTHTGGGFGSKILAQLEPLCVMLAKKARRPVKIVLTREEEFVAGTPRPPIQFWIKSAVKEAKIIARRAKAVVDIGVSASEGAIYANIAALQMIGPYDIPNVDSEGISVYTNKQPCGAFRAPGTAETNFAVESHTDVLAKRAGLDPLEFRLRNVWEDGSVGSDRAR